MTFYPTINITPADSIVYDGMETMGWGLVPASTDTANSGGVPTNGAFSPVIYKEEALDCTTTTERVSEEHNYMLGVAGDQHDDIIITQHSSTAMTVPFSPVGAAATALGAIAGAGVGSAGSSPAHPAVETIALFTSSVAGFAHSVDVATSFNRVPTKSIWHDRGDHTNLIHTRANTISDHEIEWGQTGIVKAMLTYTGLIEMIPGEGAFVPLTGSPQSSIIKRVGIDTGYQCAPFSSAEVKLNIPDKNGTIFPSMTCESGHIHVSRVTEAKPASWNGSAGAMPTAPTVGAAAGTESSSGTGPANGTYKYAFAQVDTYGNQSALSGATSTVTVAAAHPVNLTGIPVGGYATNIWRSKVGTTTPFFYVGTLYGSAVTIYTDSLLDSALGDQFFSTNLHPQGAPDFREPKDIVSAPIHVDIDGVVDYTGDAATSMYHAYKEYDNNGTSSFPLTFWMRNLQGWGLKVVTWPVKFSQFTLDKSSTAHIKGNFVGHAMMDVSTATDPSTPKNSKLAFVVYSPSAIPLVI